MKDYTADILRAVDKARTRADVVSPCAVAMLMEFCARPPQATTDWAAVNAAVASRWSWAAVTYVKRYAWKRAEASAKALSTPVVAGEGPK